LIHCPSMGLLRRPTPGEIVRADDSAGPWSGRAVARNLRKPNCGCAAIPTFNPGGCSHVECSKLCSGSGEGGADVKGSWRVSSTLAGLRRETSPALAAGDHMVDLARPPGEPGARCPRCYASWLRHLATMPALRSGRVRTQVRADQAHRLWGGRACRRTRPGPLGAVRVGVRAAGDGAELRQPCRQRIAWADRDSPSRRSSPPVELLGFVVWTAIRRESLTEQ
jgi:hypothetical protein